MRVLDPLLSWLKLWKVLFLVGVGVWLDEVLYPLLSWLELWTVLFLVRAVLFCLLVAYRPSNMRVYLRDGSAQTILRAATLR